ncbi:HIT domain-containing protein, partial [bacterium]
MKVKKPLWAPWRSQYFTAKKSKGCVFCEEAKNPDAPDSLVVAHTPLMMAVLNLYPYTTGHLMIIPKRHIALPDEMREDELKEFWALFVRAKNALVELYSPEGFNTGINLGEAAGAGIAAHLHLH